MKPFIPLLVLATAAFAEPRIQIPGRTIGPGDPIDLVLDQAACPDDRIGRESATPWLEISPPWPGKTVWKEANVLRFEPSAAPTVGTGYRFTLIGKHVHLDGSPVPSGKLGTFATPPFQIEYATMLERYANDWSPRTATWFLRFNDRVDPTEAAPFLVFENKEGKRVAARTIRATMARVKHAGYQGKTFAQLHEEAISGEAAEPDLAPDAEISGGLVVEPASPLPVGKQWRLAILSGLPGKDAELTNDTVRHIGDISPFALRKARAIVVADKPRTIVLDFTAKLPADIDSTLVNVTPEVPDLRIEARNDELHLIGDFSSAAVWHVTVAKGLNSRDGRMLGGPVSEKLTFRHLAPQLGLPSQDETQLATGSRLYRLSTVNLGSLRVRIKQLSGRQLIRAQQGYRYYTGRGADGDTISPTRLIPYEMMSGKTVAEFDIALDNPIDTSRLVVLDWDKIIAGAPAPFEIGVSDEDHRTTSPNPDPSAAAFFLEVTGTPTEGAEAKKSPSAQALIQLTDIGMAWKTTGSQALVYAFSCRTGRPLPGVAIETFGEDAEPLERYSTDERGIATMPRGGPARHLRATLGRDQFTVPYDAALPTVGLWRFPIRHSWSEPPLESRRVFLFTDRSLYRPGENVHLKGIVRRQDGNRIAAAGDSAPKLTVTNPIGREILSRDLEISAAGSFDASFHLPPETVGHHRISVTWPEELEAAAEIENWTERGHAVGNASFELGLRVEEFRRNAFEIGHTLTPPAPGDREVTLGLSASSYQGQPVADAATETWTRTTETNFYPDRYRDHLFGDHRTPDFDYWHHYFGYRWDDDYGNRSSDSRSFPGKLDAEGRAVITATLPETEFPMAREVTIQTEVTDSNRQTLTRTTTATVHPADAYVGISRLDRLVRVGDKLPMELVAVTPEGEASDETLELVVRLSREINDQVRVLSPSGGSSVRNEARQEEISETPFALKGSAEYLFAPSEPGLHTIEIRGTDAAGHPFATATTVHVYGSDQYPWAYEDGMRIRLVPEKKHHRPGDTARILVLSPIEGTALVTVEREDVSRSFLVDLKTSDPVIEVPVGEDDAPNCYVSVLVIKGAEESLREHKEPQLRLGYCELMVENRRDRLAVTLAAGPPTSVGTNPPDTFLPGSEITITGQVLFSNNQSAANAEVTLYAEDEGTLAVVGYETPDPMAHFYDPRLLRVRCGTSLGNFIPVAPDEQTFHNKGFFIGGGDGDMTGPLDLPRRDFNPCAFWKPALTSDATGKFNVTVRLPDTLTRYRLIAVAHHGASRFGHAESEFTVAKPLMIEPQTPRFAHETDTIDTQAKITNASDHEGTWKVTFTPNPPASDPIAKPASEQGSVGSLPTSTTLEKEITLAPNQSTTLSFPVAFINTGEALFKWEAVPVSLSTGNLTPELTRYLSDSVENHFQVEYPVPLQRQTKLIRLTGDGGPVNLLEGLDPNLLEGRGHLDIEMSRSLLLEAGGAIDHLLRYPYGCLEQTTSSLIPWLTVGQLRAVSPELAKHSEAEVRKNIQGGIDRLLSMQQRDGGFSYWPGSSESLSWASSYAGLALILASEQGEVPPAALSSLTSYLVRDLREIGKTDDSSEYEIAARHLWVLALSNNAQPSYVNLLRDRIGQLNSRTRSLLALAENAAGNKDQAIAILRNPTPFKGSDHSWMRWQPDHAYRLLAWASIDPTSDESTVAIDKLLRDRNPYGHWNTTWTNAWSLLALFAYAKSEDHTGPTRIALQASSSLQTATDPTAHLLDGENPVTPERFTLVPGLKVTASSDGPALVRVLISAKPKIAPMQPVSKNGLQITRFYERVNADGTSAPLDSPEVGDLVRVSLRVTLPDDDLRYLVIEDMLPSVFETVNNSFDSQSANLNAGGTSESKWDVSHSELRDDRALFFLDRGWRNDTKTLTYLARVTQSGSAIAPPAKVESMYDPDNLALSASRLFKLR